MAQSQVGSSAPAKLSFAKIAAMPAPNVTPAVPNIHRSRPSNSATQHTKTNSQVSATQVVPETITPNIKPEVEDINVAVERLSIPEHGQCELQKERTGESRDSPADDRSQLSGSSLKQQSFDTKSMTSVTTFAMDEKESIRPDDSASVRAADDDDVHPGLSRNSSFQHEIEPQPTSLRNGVRMLGPNVTIAARRHPFTTLTNPPRFGDLPPGPLVDTPLPETDQIVAPVTPVIDENQTRLSISNVAPDEKLLEALSSPKDRLPLLQLEERIMAFVTGGRDTVLELPPQNSFTRLLTHKIADYYNLAHHINEDNSSVRIFRTDCTVLPLSLAEIARSVPVSNQQITKAIQVKIMRRAQLGPRQFSTGNSTAASSSVPSKTTSENGNETNSEEGLQSPSDGTPNKDRSKLTREEREAQYKAARERIFGDFQESVTSESGSTGEASVSMSRSSSSSGKKKSRKHKAPKDDTFEARSAFIPSYTPMHMHPTYQQVYNDMMYSGGFVPPNHLSNVYNNAPAQHFMNFDPNMSYNNGSGYSTPNPSMMGNMENWQTPQQNASNGFYNYQNHQPYQQQMHVQMTNPFQPSSPPPVSQSQSWTQNQYQASYMQSPGTPNGSSWQNFHTGNHGRNSAPYQYGQLPPQGSTTGISFANQHPVPGSYSNNKSLFNPQTRSFVPGNTPPRGNNRNSRKKGQTSNSTRSSGTSSPAVSNLNENVSTKTKEDSLQQKYGTPATLPKKPPPSQVSPHFSNDHAQSSNSGPLVVNGSGGKSSV